MEIFRLQATKCREYQLLEYKPLTLNNRGEPLEIFLSHLPKMYPPTSQAPPLRETTLPLHTR